MAVLGKGWAFWPGGGFGNSTQVGFKLFTIFDKLAF